MTEPQHHLHLTPPLERAGDYPQGLEVLSPRELQILELVSLGYLDKEISLEAHISVNTLRTYFRRIRDKLGQHSRSILAVAYTRYATALAPAHSDGSFTPDWEIDLITNRVKFVSERDHPQKHLDGADLEDTFSIYDAEDQPKVREMFRRAKAGELDTFLITGKFSSPTGRNEARAYCRVIRDQEGSPVKVEGMRIPNAVYLHTD